MIKIVYIVSTLKSTGPINQLFNIISNLDSSVYSPVVLTLSPEPEESKMEKYLSYGIEVHSLNLSRLSALFWARGELNCFIKKIMPKLIHTQGFRADILSSKLDFNIPKVSTIRNFPQKDFSMTYGSLIGKIMTHQQIKALKNFDVCVGVSDAVTNNLIESFDVRKFLTIRNGVDTRTFRPADNILKSTLRSKLGFPSNSRIWLVSGHLSDRKDPLFLIKTWIEIFSNDIENYLVLIGDGDLKKECVELAEGVSNIKVKGRIINVVDYLQASDFYLAASKAEGMPNAALEALACGLPLLLSNIQPHSELVKMNDNIGLTYKVNDVLDFSDKVREMINLDYNRMRNASLSLINVSLSAIAMSDNYQMLYKKLISEV